MELIRILTIKEKALKINLDPTFYGSFAEIGAGQETAAIFFKAGGASGTIAKTISAYDMKFSDAIYGKSARYVSRERLLKMLDHEIELLLERLSHRSDTTKFFVFANTVEVLNFHRTNQGHGWLGFRFQLHPNAAPNECVIHVILNDRESIRQQQALSMLGVNLIYGCFYISGPEALMLSLMDNLHPGRIEIDYFRITGPDFEQVDNRLMALKLVKSGLSKATLFEPNGEVQQPQDALYKKNVLILRGRFRPVTKVNLDMLESGMKAFREDVGQEQEIVTISELTLTDLSGEEGISDRDFLHRVDNLSSLGQKVMITDFPKFYSLAAFITQITRGKVGILMGILTLRKLFDEKYYQDLKGGILEAFGIMFRNNLKLYIYPSLQNQAEVLQVCENLDLPGRLQHLFRFLNQGGQIKDLNYSDIENLKITSSEVLKLIRENNPVWENQVPEIVAEAIKKKKLFDYQGS